MSSSYHLRNILPLCGAVSLILTGCYSLDRYDTKYGIVRLAGDVGGASILSRSGDRSSILSGGNIRVRKLIHYKDNYMLFILPESSYLQDKKYFVDGDVFARWPSGAESQLYVGTDYTGGDDSIPPFTCSHPDPKGSRRREYDELAYKGPLEQEIVFSAFPDSGVVSQNGKDYKSELTNSYSFNYEDFMASSKWVTVFAKWPSGISTTNAKIPICVKKNSYGFEYNDKYVSLCHPNSNSVHFLYDSMPNTISVLEVDTDPSGAEIFCQGKSFGFSPVSLTQQVSFAEFCATSMIFDVSAIWKSGTKCQDKIVYDLHKGEPKHYIIKHPSESQSNEVDYIFAKEQTWERQYATNLPIKTLVLTSDPEGATIYDGEKQIGPCPALLTWAFTKVDYMSGSMQTPTFTARWPSGATLDRHFNLQFDNLTPETQTFIRPSTAPDKEIDVNYAIQLKQIEATKEVHARQQELQQRAIEEQERQARQDDLFRAMQASEDRRREDNRMLMQQLNEESRRSSERMDRAIEQDRIQQQRQADERRLQMEMLQNTSKTLMDMVPKTTTGSGYINTPSGNANYFYRQTEYGH